MASSDVVLVDSNVLIDVLSRDPTHYVWSAARLAEILDGDGAAINPIVYAEVSVGFASSSELDRALPRADFCRLELPWEAAFGAAKAFVAYRRRGGRRSAPLPDFFIGAHAEAAGLALLTRDPARFRTYFPGVELIAPA